MAEEIILRRAVRKEGRALRALIHRVRINPLGIDWRRFLVAVDSAGQLLGCGQVKPHRDGSRELASIAVEPSARGRGLASRIIRRLLQETVERPLFLTCRAELGPFYARFGFRPAREAELSPYFRTLQRFAGRLSARLSPDDRMCILYLE